MQIMETERLVLRELTLDDFESLHRILSDPITMQFWPMPFTREATQQWIERNIQHYERCGHGRWAVILKQSNELIGDCGIASSEIDGNLEYDLGYIFHYPYWGQGYASEAASACLRFAVQTLGLQRVVANMATDHRASAKVAEKLGMRRIKIFSNTRNRGITTFLYAFTLDS
jgi:RimJ/RimL family protein N-acetyltransferase